MTTGAPCAGLCDVSVEAVEHTLVVERHEDYWERMLVSSPSRKVGMAAALSPAEVAELREATLARLRRQFGTGAVRLTAQAFVVAGSKGKGAL